MIRAKRLFICCASCCCLAMITQSAQADPTGITPVIKTQDPGDPSFNCNADFNVDVCNLFVDFESLGDNLLNAAFSNITTTAPDGFFSPIF